MTNAIGPRDITFFKDLTHDYQVFKVDPDLELPSEVRQIFNRTKLIDHEQVRKQFLAGANEKNGKNFDSKELLKKYDLYGLVSKVERSGEYQMNCFHSEQFRGSRFGKHHHFLCAREDFYKSEFGLPAIKANHSKVPKFQNREIRKTEEVIFSDPVLWDKYRGKDVLIVAAGPSSTSVKWQNIKHDYLWTCNEFYHSGLFDNKKIDLAFMAAEIKVANNQVLDAFINNSPETKFIFEVERGHLKQDLNELNGFLEKYQEKSHFFHSRYRAVIGMGARQVIAAIIAGAKNIYIAGLDGRDSTESHDSVLNVFNNSGGKKLPGWWTNMPGSAEIQYSQFFIFWRYICELARENNCSVFNLGQENEFNKSSEITKVMLPWTNDVEEALR